jgi:hypothetical protein
MAGRGFDAALIAGTVTTVCRASSGARCQDVEDAAAIFAEHVARHFR